MVTIEEEKIEKKHLKETSKIVNKIIDDLKQEVKISGEDLVEFKKLAWQDSNSFDNADIAQAKMATSEEESQVLMKQKYLKKLLKIQGKPYFASIVYKDNEEQEDETIYISTTYVKDENNDNIIYDWRSPICSLFYDFETGPCYFFAPGGKFEGTLKRKRQYKIEDDYLVGVFDNSLNIDDELLQEVLATSSSDKMKNVVNTIQEEQNKVIRNLEDKNLIVQGIAGSGKTSVALHRIAFLLYRLEHLNSNNILIFSPNNIFADYISNVLPELGEDNTLQTTFNDYLSFYITEYENIETFSDFISRYYTYQETNVDLVKYKQSDEIIEDFDKYIDFYIANSKFVKDLRESDKHFVTKSDLNELLHYKYDKLPLFERLDEIADKLCYNMYNGKMKKKTTFRKLLKECANFSEDLKQIYKHFFLSKFCKIKLNHEIVNKFVDVKVLNYEDSLLFAYLKGRLTGFTYEANIKQVVIDEAQDYNRLQYIIISKIFKKASFTILGDIHQNINPYYKHKSLKDLCSIFMDSKYIELLKTYRSSPQIIEYTNKILGLKHVNAIRRQNSKPVSLRRNITDLKKVLLEDIGMLELDYLKIAIITKDNIIASKIYNILKDDIKITLIDDNTKEVKKDLVVLPAYLAKGLEFDSVIVYNDPTSRYKREEKHLLYVACTRAQHELYIYN